MKSLSANQSIKELTMKMVNNEKFAYVVFPKSVLSTIIEKNTPNKKYPKAFLKSVNSSIETKDDNYMKCIPNFLLSSEEYSDIKLISGFNNSTIYDAAVFEYFYLNKRDIFEYFSRYFLRNSRVAVVSFHDKSITQRVIGTPYHHVHVPYNDFYDKLDKIASEITQLDGAIDYCIFDCPVLSTALSYKIWENSNISTLDFGKLLSLSKK